MQEPNKVYTAQEAYDFMSTPNSRKLKKFEKDALDKADKETVSFKHHTIQKYEWGKGKSKTLLFSPGWEGHAGNFGALVDILLQKDYHIVAYDAPGHNNSSKTVTHMFEFSELLSREVAVVKPQFYISHSFGSVSAAIGMSNNKDIPVKNWLLITTPFCFRDRIRYIANQLNLDEKTHDELSLLIEQNCNINLNSMNMQYYAPLLKHVEKATIIHSKEDMIIPIEAAKRSQAELPQCDFIELEKVGHFNMLWSAKVKELVQELL